MPFLLVSLQLCLCSPITLDGAWSDVLGALLLQALTALTLPYIFIYPFHQSYTLCLGFFLLGLFLLPLHLFNYILT